jgi:hypothetical protein
MNLITKLFFVMLLIAEAMRSAALAQTVGTDPKACANASGGPNQTLSDKLDKSGGVICPPNVDPAMKKPTPQTGDMPVMPPPGTPGGNPAVQPK